ncbi:hypothetical protein SpAn4DRAFT_3090 [Sporomusa ovata]|uniref:Uncharacterized protein n=1 Tax=Sporomusa ovata TaxID=2378 RepID=A0A0U1KYY5_9FIRM|nr:hypothetical protein SpAn4DRAFT_3090 [Sporomusa ovata]
MYSCCRGRIFTAAALIGSANESGAAAGVTGHVDCRAGFQVHRITKHLNSAACLPCGFAGGVKGAGIRHRTAFQPDNAVDILHTLCPYQPSVVDYCRQQGVFGTGTHDHQTSVRGDGATVYGAAARYAGVDSNIQQAVAAKVQTDLLSGRKTCDLGGYNPFVSHLRADKYGLIISGYRALIDNTACVAAAEDIVA